MLSINKVMLTGRLTRDADVRFLPTGTAVTNFRIAVSRRFLDAKTNEWREEVVFIDVEAWGKLAERCAETLKKGKAVYVEGRLRQDTWERDNQKQSRILILAERVTPFDVGGRSDTELAVDTSEPNPAGQSTAAGPTKQTATPPSNGLDFSTPNVEDDIPF